MNLNITKINSASTSVQYNYLGGEHTWGATIIGQYSFKINDVTGNDGDTLYSDIHALERAYGKEYITAKIGTDEFRNGIIKNLKIDDYNGVGYATASVQIEENIRFDSDDRLNELSGNIPSPQDIESISETFTFNRNADGYVYNRTVNLSYKQDAGHYFLDKAYLFLKNIYINNRPNFGFHVDGLSENARFSDRRKGIITEKYNLIEKSVELSEDFNSAEIIEDYSKFVIKTINVLQEGFVETSFNIEVQALAEPMEQINCEASKQIIDDLISENGTPIVIEKGINEAGGLSTINIVFTSDPRSQNLTNIDYIVTKNFDGSFDNYTFEIKISSKAPTDQSRFIRNREFWKLNTNLGLVKIPILFPEATILNEVSRSLTFQPFNNEILEIVNFTNNPDYNNNDGITFRNVNISDNKPVPRDTVIPIYGRKEILIRNDGAYTLGSRSINVEMNSNDTDILESKVIDEAKKHKPSADSVYLISQEIVLDIINKKIQGSLTYNYFDE